MSCPVCTVATCMHTGLDTPCALQDVSEVALSQTSSPMWPLLERSVHVTSDFHCEWAIVAMQTMASTDETFLPWCSPYRSSHWIGRSTSGLRPCCCHRGGMTVRVFLSSLWIVFELTNDARTRKIRAEVIYGKTYVRNNIYIDKTHVLLVSVGLAQARPN